MILRRSQISVANCGRTTILSELVNKKHDYRALEREYVAGDMSVRELARRHGIANPSLVHVQAKRLGWYDKRDALRQRAGAKTIERLADAEARRAERVFEVEDHALEVIDEALTKMSKDMHRSRMVEHGGQLFEEPIFLMTPKDLALLIDRLQIFLNAPSRIVEQRSVGLTVTSDLSIDVLKQFAALTREQSTPPKVHEVLPTGRAH